MNEPASPQDQFTVILGGVERKVKLRTGQEETVIIRQLPIRLLNEWSIKIGDEAGLAELYCDKVDKAAVEKLRALGVEVLGLLKLVQAASNPADVQKASEQLAVIRSKSDTITRETSWDDTLTPEAHDEIIRIGWAINRPRFDRWIADRDNAIGHLKTVYKEYLPDHPLLKDEPNPAKPPASGTSSRKPVSPVESPTLK
jgi:hypothetical protein